MYGQGTDNVVLTVSARDLQRVLASSGGRNTLIDLTIDGTSHLVRLGDIDQSPIGRGIHNVGFQEISRTTLRKATISVRFLGEPETVRMHTGRLDVIADHLDVRALPEQTVSYLSLETGAMEIGDSLTAGDVSLPTGYVLLTEPKTLLVALRAANQAVRDAIAAEPEAAA